MVEFFKNRVIAGKKKWTDVPELKSWNSDVQEALKADGYILNKDGTVNKNKEG